MTERVLICEDSVPGLPPGVRLHFDKRRDQWVVLAPERVFVLDSVAFEIVKRCNGETRVAVIVDDLATTFTAPRAVVLKDVSALLQDLADKRVLAA